MARIQTNRILKVKTPLGDDVLLLKRITGGERISGLFEYELELYSEKGNIDATKLIGDTMTVTFVMENGDSRYFNGYVSRFSQTGFYGVMAKFQATIVPWTWLLTRKADCRIFQEKSVPEIIKEIFTDSGFSDYEISLTGEYRKWEYCVQYCETDFNFVSRLMEQEGISFFFKHKDGKHIMVLADSYSSHEPTKGYEEIPFFPPDNTDRRKRDHISGWSTIHQLQPGIYAHNDFDFKKPKKALKTKSVMKRQNQKSDYEVYFYPGEYMESDEGENYAKVRLREFQGNYQIYKGEGSAQGITTGSLFKLTDFSKDDLNKEYLIISVSCNIESNDLDAGATGGTTFYTAFTTVDSKDDYRPSRTIPKPLINGAQTAIVTGPKGEEIFTDEFGRVKVQFHWDRYGKLDENSSCWIRVAQIWAGSAWGAIHIPRIGQEVIVEFLEGDPDRPIITGRVYNGDSMPPYALPANKTQSGIKSRSTKEGGVANFNEIRFEDKKGSEEFYEHAEKDKTIITEHDKKQETGHDEILSIGNDRTKTVTNDETTSIGHDRTENVGNDETIVVKNNRTESVGKDETISIGANRTESVGKDETISIDGSRTESVGKDETISIGKDLTLSIDGSSTRSVKKDEAISITGGFSLSVEKDATEKITKNYTLSAKKITIKAEDQIQIEAGDAKITMKKDGTIKIEGKDITIKGSGDIKMKGSKIGQN